MRSFRLALTLSPLLFLAASVQAGTEEWHQSMDAGMKASKKSGKPVLVVTSWRDEQ